MKKVVNYKSHLSYISGGFYKINRGDMTMRKILKISGILLIVLTIFSTFNSIVAVNMPVDPGYDETKFDNQALKDKTNSFVGTFIFIVQVLCIVTMIAMGLRYMFVSAEGKANIKKEIIVWCIGAIFVFASTTLIAVILEVITGEEHVSITPVEKPAGTGSHWAEDIWREAEDEGIIPDSIKDKLGNDAKITRGQFAELVHALLDEYVYGFEAGNTNKFTDVSNVDLGKKITDLYNAGIVTGTSVNALTFAPNNDITRQDAITIFYRLLLFSGSIKESEIDLTGGEADKFNEVADYAKNAMVFMYNYSIIVGDEHGSLNPLGNLTCEEAITIANRIVGKYYGEE